MEERNSLIGLLWLCGYVFIGSMLSGLFLRDHDKGDGCNRREAFAVFCWPVMLLVIMLPLALLWLARILLALLIGCALGVRDAFEGR